MTLVSTVTVGSGGAATIDFTGIAGTGTDLLVVYSLRDTANNAAAFIGFNGVTTNQTRRMLYGTGSSAASYTDSSILTYINQSSYTANTFGNGSFYIPNYAGSTAKSLSMEAVSENNGTAAEMAILAGLWNSTAAITRVTFTAIGTFAQYSTASLYTVTKGSGGASVS